MTSPRVRSAYFQLAADLVRAKYGTIPSPLHFLEDVPMTFKAGDRVTVPGAGSVRLSATVVTLFEGSRRPVCVHVDGDAVEQMEAHLVADVRPLVEAHDTRPADHIADFCYYPAECEVCQRPTVQGSAYCGPVCERIMTGRPSVTEQMADL